MAGLSVALLSYRSKPHGGGQGIYVRHLSRELAAQGHRVTVFSGQPYPELDPGVALEKLPSLDLYREDDPFRTPHPREFRDGIDVLEYLSMCTAGFPEPRTFSMRAARELRSRVEEFDVVHDNQCLGYGLRDIAAAGLPLVTTIHHPITRDRATDLASATGWRRVTLRRWYGFLRMQGKVAREQRHILTVSQSSARDIVEDFAVSPKAVRVVPLGVETDVFAPVDAPRVPGRIVAMASADTPLKGTDTLIEAVARVARRRPVELVLVTKPVPGGPTERLVRRLGMQDRVRFVNGLSTPDLVELVATAQVACVPSRYEGFSLPTVEAMSCGTPLVVTRAGAIPEVVGEPGVCADVVEPGRPEALADALLALLDDPERGEAMGRAGRERAVSRFSWPAVARATAEVYAEAIAAARPSIPRGHAPTTASDTPSAAAMSTAGDDAA